jgi:hypothetical protein
VIAIASVLGVIMSQVSRGLIFRLLFGSFRKWEWFWKRPFTRWLFRDPVDDKTDIIFEAVAQGRVKPEQYEVLVTEYFRYAEASVNMVIPVFVFGLGISVFGAYVEVVQMPYWIATLVISGLCALVLLFSGYQTHASYLQKIHQLLRAAGYPEEPPREATAATTAGPSAASARDPAGV